MLPCHARAGLLSVLPEGGSCVQKNVERIFYDRGLPAYQMSGFILQSIKNLRLVILSLQSVAVGRWVLGRPTKFHLHGYYSLQIGHA